MNRFEFSKEEGFTYIEVIAAIFIVSLLAFVLWNGVSIAFNVIDKSYTSAKVNNELGALEYRFRTLVNSIEYNYWENEPHREAFMFSNRDNQMTFKYKEELYSFEYLEFLSIDYTENRAILIIRADKGTNIEIAALWGSFVLGDNL